MIPSIYRTPDNDYLLSGIAKRKSIEQSTQWQWIRGYKTSGAYRTKSEGQARYTARQLNIKILVLEYDPQYQQQKIVGIIEP